MFTTTALKIKEKIHMKIGKDLRGKLSKIEDPATAASRAMAEKGYHVPAPIMDGKIYRFDYEGKRNNKNGWYCFYSDGIPAGSFGDWINGKPYKWSHKSETEMTAIERKAFDERLEQIRIERERERAEGYAKAAKKAENIWNSAKPAEPDYPYLLKKGVAPNGIRLASDGRLIVPVFGADGKIQSLQFIDAAGEKRFLTCGEMRGGIFVIDGNHNDIAICEGYATGASIQKATGKTVYVGFNAGNLKATAKIVKDRHPGAAIVVCCDDDRETDGNPGLTKGREAAEAIGAVAAVPVFKDVSTRPTDFNDLAALEGLDEVKRQIETPTTIQSDQSAQDGPIAKMAPLTPSETQVRSRLITEPTPAEFIMTCRGYPFLRKGIVSMIVASGGMGKTFFMLRLAAMMAAGGRWGCFEAPKPLRTLFIGAEDDQDELDRRLWTIGNGHFHENLHAASVVGKVGFLMKKDGMNPARSEWYEWLRKTVDAHMPLDILFLDPLIRLYGLDENSNSDAGAFITTLESLSQEFDGLNVKMSHHVNKNAALKTRASQGDSRGAAAFVDCVRHLTVLTDVSDDDIKTYSIEDPQQFFKLDVPKSNNSAKLTAPVFFKKDQYTGIPEYINLSADKIAGMADGFYRAFSEYGQTVSEKKLLRGEPKELFDSVKGNILKITISKDMGPILSYLLEKGMLTQSTIDKNGKPSRTYSADWTTTGQK